MALQHDLQALVAATLLLASVCLGAGNNTDDLAARKLLADESGTGLPVGALAPQIRLKDQHGRERDRRTLAGPSGLVIVFFRSADW